MFGKNAVASKMQYPDGRLLINDVFYTFQGEGPDAGRPAVFVRLAKCNLRCFFCDTDFERGIEMTRDEAFKRIIDFVPPHVCNLVVITGGEPLLQNIVPLVQMLNQSSISVAVETAGTVWLPNLQTVFASDRSIGGNIIVCSPKTPGINQKLEPLIGAFKYILRVGETSGEDGLPAFSTQLPGEPAHIYRPRAQSRVPVYVQACDEQDVDKTQKNLELAASSVLAYGYRLSVQTHKLAGVP